MEILPGIYIDISLSLVVGLMIKTLMVLILVFSVIMVRQASMMDRVVNLPIGNTLKKVVWAFFVLAAVLTFVVVVA